MVSVTSLWLPILVAAALVFVVSSVIHMLLGYHAADYGAVPAEDDVQAALRKFSLSPGDYMVPCPKGSKPTQDFIDKHRRGPALLMTVMPAGEMAMGAQLAMWFVYCVVTGTLVGYVAGIALPAGADYRAVFRLASTVAFIGYVLALWQMSIWYRKSWGSTLRSTLDGLIYALLTAGVFGWLWPR